MKNGTSVRRNWPLADRRVSNDPSSKASLCAPGFSGPTSLTSDTWAPSFTCREASVATRAPPGTGPACWAR